MPLEHERLQGHLDDHPNLGLDGRELTAEQMILVHKPERYASIAALVDAQMLSRDQPCRGRETADEFDDHAAECDEGGECDRHRRFSADRYVALVSRWQARFRATCVSWLLAAPHSPEERELGRLVERVISRRPYLDAVVTRAMREVVPNMRWHT
jgi:hypothetical protein